MHRIPCDSCYLRTVLDVNRLPRGYQLRWPPELFRDELEQILDHGPFNGLEDWLRRLFEEAFVGSEPSSDVPASGIDVPDSAAYSHGQWVLDHVHELPTEQPRRYFRQRAGGQPPADDLPADPAMRQTAFQNAVHNAWRTLDALGYFRQATGADDCVDDDGPAHATVMKRLIVQRAGLDVTWPPPELPGPKNEQPLPAEDFYTLVEALHDLVARPRVARWHAFDEHYWYGDFDQHTGEAIYRWLINSQFDRFKLDFRLADEPPDKGYVVTTVRDPRATLETQVAHHTSDSSENRELVHHAISLFHHRGATVLDKRSACKDLADVLESRRGLILSEMLSKDEGNLFEIANKYRVRHHKADQYADYGEEFLDWIFWNFLSAVELTNRLINRAVTLKPTS